ncbi:MAG TPA: aldehyde dehydrogenase family protein [Conexibacter sp.]|nr:aldehyde dehydrogenase family protein [Conexibacter sp.]
MLNLIDGEWVEALSGESFPVRNPATGEQVASAARSGAEDVDRAVAAARRAFESGPWARMSPAERGRIVWRIGELVEERAEEFAQLESLDNGRPISQARQEGSAAAAHYRYMAGWATKLEGATIPVGWAEPGQYLAYTVHEPVGVVGAIVPWNFPLLMATTKLSPALAAGNTVVLKPAEQAPLSAALLGEVLLEAGVPAGVVNIVHGIGADAGAALAAHPGVDKVGFTGSTEVGKLIIDAAKGNLKKVALELGGKSPNIVFADADLQTAIPGAAEAIFYNQGEVCTAGSRLFVEKRVFDEVVDGVAAAARSIKVAPGLDPASEMGPVVSEEQFARVLGYLQAGEQEGAEAVAGGRRHGEQGWFVEPTVLVNTTPEMQVVREEIFGPVVTVIPFDDPGEIAATANDTRYGLAAGVWTRDIAKAHRTAASIKAGIVWVNTYNTFDSALPFGGYKQSGWGRENGEAGIHAYTQTKTIVVHT